MTQLEIQIPKKIYVYDEPVSMSNSFDGLARIVKEKLHKKPDSTDMYLFINKDRKYIKVLTRAVNGWVILAKRLVEGTFTHSKARQITAGELQKIVDAVTVETIETES